MKKFYMLGLGVLTIGTAISQTHTINNDTLHISGYSSDSNVAANTYFNTFADVDVAWSLVDAEIPEGWEFSFCFPICYPIGVTEATNTFPANSHQYLNCHVYPNGVHGTGVIRLMITTNEVSQDTVTWMVSFEEPSNVNIFNDASVNVAIRQSLDKFSITSLPKGAQISLFDIKGAKVMEYEARNECETFSSGQLSGFYILTVRSTNRLIFRRKLVIL